MAKIFVPTEQDHLKAVQAVSRDVIQSPLTTRAFFSHHLRSSLFEAEDREVMDTAADLIVSRNRLNGEFYAVEDGEFHAVTMMGMVAGSLCVARMYEDVESEANPVTVTESLYMIRNVSRYLIDTMDAQRRDAVELGTPMPDEGYACSQFERSASMGLDRSGEATREIIDGWSEQVSPRISVQPFFLRGVGLLLRSAQELSDVRHQEEERMSLKELEAIADDAGSVDWDAEFQELLGE